MRLRRLREAGALVTRINQVERSKLRIDGMNQWLKGRLCLIRYSSVGWTLAEPHRPRLPARERRTFPPAVILKRLAADFLVLMPLRRRITINFLSKRVRNIRV